ncbi:Dabb family protein [soil metagenome]
MSENLSTSVLRHVVLFGFKATATPAQIQEVERAFTALPSQITSIQTLEWGTNVSPENLSAGYTHCFFLTFASEVDRDAYLPHPAHKAFGALIQPYVGQVLVVDYWSQA